MAKIHNSYFECPHCEQSESLNHMLFHCTYAVKVWKCAPFDTQVDSCHITDLIPGMRSGKLMKCLPLTGVATGKLFYWICLNIWKSRNQWIFKIRIFSPEDTISKSIQEAIEWNAAQSPVASTPVRSGRSNPSSSIRADTTVCHFDAAWRQESWEAGLGWILINPLLNVN